MSDNNPDQALRMIEGYGLRLGKNWKKILGDLLSDIGGRECMSCADILRMSEIKAILEDNKESAPKKMENLKSALSRIRYPRYSAATKRFDKLVRDLALPGSMKIIPAPFFESKHLRIEIVYAHEKGLDKEIEAIKRISETDLVKEALETEDDNN